MGMSTSAVGFKPADEKWNSMKAVWEACEKAGTAIPEEVEDYFEGEPPEDKPGMEVDLGDSCQEWQGESSDGYEIDITKLPEGVRFIRVINYY